MADEPRIEVTDDAGGMVKLPYLLDYQKRIIASTARFTWNNWSRQAGKSTALGWRRILRGIKRRKNQIFLSAGERQSRELMMKAQQQVEALKLVCAVTEQDMTDPFDGTTFKSLEIGIPSLGIRIIGLPANPRTARGFTGDVFLDEFAMHQKDRDIWASVFPTVLRGKGELDIASTPKGRQNMFYRLASSESFEQSTVTIYDAVADGLEVDVDELKAAMNDDELFRQEFLCEFVDEATAFLTYEMIAECEDPKLERELDLEELRKCKGDLYAGMDIGRRKDLTVIWVFELVGSQLIHRGIIELRAMPFRQQYAILRDVLKLGAMRRCCIDETGLGMMMAEQALDEFGSHRVEACTFTSPFRGKIAAGLRVKVEDHNFRIPVCELIRNDLHSIRRSITASDQVRYEAERTGESHADRFWTGALAVYAASDAAGPIEAIFGPELASAGARGW